MPKKVDMLTANNKFMILCREYPEVAFIGNAKINIDFKKVSKVLSKNPKTSLLNPKQYHIFYSNIFFDENTWNTRC